MYNRKSRKRDEDLSPAYRRRLRCRELRIHRERHQQALYPNQPNVNDEMEVENDGGNPIIEVVNAPIHDHIPENEHLLEVPQANDPGHEFIPEDNNLLEILQASDNESDRSDESEDMNDMDDGLDIPIQPVDFQTSFAAACDKASLKQTQVNILLELLRNHHCFAGLPKDARTLLHTPRTRTPLYEISGGQYLDLGLEDALCEILKRTPRQLIPRELIFDFSTDGVKIDNGNSANAWPIQVRIANIPHSKPEFVGIWLGNGNNSKPLDSNAFFSRFVTEYLEIQNRHGIIFENELKPTRVRAFIADAPARAFVLRHKGHGGYSPCSRCKVLGEPGPNKVVYPEINFVPRLDEEYYDQVDHEHHDRGPRSILHLILGFSLVLATVFDWMHCILLGLMGQFFASWITGKYNKLLKLDELEIEILNARLTVIANDHCPCEFSRQPVNLRNFSKHKATENRQILLHSGFAVFSGVLNPALYFHFLKLACGLKILVRSATNREISIAGNLLRLFFRDCRPFYGRAFYTYNLHTVLHLGQDANNFGPLDNISAFPYENAMQYFNHTCRKPHQYLQQIRNRRAERLAVGVNVENDRNVPNIIPGKKWRNDNLPAFLPANTLQYQILKCPRYTVNLNGRDDTLVLNDGSICIVKNVIQYNGAFQFVINRFLPPIDPLFDIGWPSTFFGVYKCSILSNNPEVIRINQVRGKCFRMPYFNNKDCIATPNVWVISLMSSTFN